MPETISGTVERIYFSSPDFSAGVLDIGPGGRIKFSGKFLAVAGETISLTGVWKDYPKYGRQFSVGSLSYDLPQTKDGLIRYLAKNAAFKGIDEVMATRLVEYADTAERLDNLIRTGMDELHAALRIPLPALQTLREQWIAHAGENKIRAYLSSFELTPHQISTLLERFGENIVGVLKSNPYVLMRHVSGYGVKRVDEIARKTGVPKNHPGRLRAGVIHVATEEIDSGRTWIDARDLVRHANDLLVLDDLDSLEQIKTAGKELIECGDLVAEGAAITLPAIRDDERLIFDTFIACMQSPGHNIAADTEQTNGLLLGQRKALELALCSRICVISGAARTGKSVTVSRIAGAFQNHGLKVAVCAPTGKAAKRAEELFRQYGLDLEAKTIHRLLGYNGNTYASETIDADVLIGDEVSMVSVDLMAELLRHTDFNRTTLILVGDHNQLPSVGPGSILRDVILHRLAPVEELTEVVRQAGILKTNCNAVLAGRIEPTDPSKHEWLVIDRFKQPEEIQACLRDLIREYIPQFLHYDPLRDVQIISPTHKGLLGTREINRMMQGLHHGSVQGVFTVGDRIVQKANDYGLNIFIGSLGTVTAIDKEGIHVEFDLEGERLIPQDKTGALQLAYCLTIHSTQGSEAPCVILLLHKSHWHACRQLTYTGVTRARKTLILLGDRWGIRHSVQDQRSAERRTLLSLWANEREKTHHEE